MEITSQMRAAEDSSCPFMPQLPFFSFLSFIFTEKLNIFAEMTISTIMAEIPYLSFEWKILIWIGRFCSVSCFRIDNQFEIWVELQKVFLAHAWKS